MPRSTDRKYAFSDHVREASMRPRRNAAEYVCSRKEMALLNGRFNEAAA